MKCAEYRNDLTELARGTGGKHRQPEEALAHLGKCVRCQGEFGVQLRLNDALARLAAETAGSGAPPALEGLLLAEFSAVHKVAPRNWKPGFYWLAGVAAACLLLVWGGWYRGVPSTKARGLPPVLQANVLMPPPGGPAPDTFLRPQKPAASPSLRPQRRAAPVLADALPAADEPFVAIPFTAPMGPYERADIVQMDLPVSALIAAGFPLRVSDTGARARADLVVGEDGRARAVRLISISNSGF